MKTKVKTKSKPGATRSKSSARAKKAGGLVEFLHKPNCTTCRKARQFLEKRGVELHFRDLDKERLSPEELEKLIGDGDHNDFLNSRNELYREKDMGEKPPTRKQAIQMMSKTPNLIRRPVVVAGGRVVVGFDKEGMARLFN